MARGVGAVAVVLATASLAAAQPTPLPGLRLLRPGKQVSAPKPAPREGLQLRLGSLKAADKAPAKPAPAAAKAGAPQGPGPLPPASARPQAAPPTAVASAAPQAAPAAVASAPARTVAAAAPAAPVVTDIALQPGQSRVLEFEALDRVVTSDPNVADVVPASKSDLVVTAKGPGESTLFVWDAKGRHDYRVLVSAQDLEPVAAALREAIDNPNISVRVLGGTIFLEGTVESAAEAQRAEALAQAVGKTVKNVIQVEEPPAPAPDSGAAAEVLNRALEGTGARARAISETAVVVEGKLTAVEAERARRIFGAADKGISVVDALEVVQPERQQVQIRARIVDINRTKLKNLGVNWGSVSSEQQGGTIRYTFVDQPFLYGIINDKATNLLPFGAQLNALIQENAARILSEPNLVVMEGSQGSILVGGEFPIPVVQNQVGGIGSITVQFKEFGVRMQVEPLEVREESVTLKVTPEVSLLDFANAVQVSGITLPALRTRREETTIRIRPGQVFAIGGLIESNFSRNVRRIPLLSQIPILGELFKNRNWTRSENELVILIRPEIVPLGDTPTPNPLDVEAPNLPIPRPKAPETVRPEPLPEGSPGTMGEPTREE